MINFGGGVPSVHGGHGQCRDRAELRSEHHGTDHEYRGVQDDRDRGDERGNGQESQERPAQPGLIVGRPYDLLPDD